MFTDRNFNVVRQKVHTLKMCDWPTNCASFASRASVQLFRRVFPFIMLGVFAGCQQAAYQSDEVILPQYVKKIAIGGFVDQTQHTIMQEKVVYSLKDAFLQDRRIALTNEDDADAILVGDISRYMLEPIEYDENFVVKKYVLWIWIDVTLVDRASRVALWTEKRMEVKVQFDTTTDDPIAPNTETEAQDIAADTFAKNIVSRTIDGWFAASGVSGRK